MLGFDAVALTIFARPMSIFPSTALRGVRSRGESCASAVMPKVMAIAEARAPRENLRLLEALQFNGDSPQFSSWARILLRDVRRERLPTYIIREKRRKVTR